MDHRAVWCVIQSMRPIFSPIVGGAVGALLIAAIGVSAHSGAPSILESAVVQHSQSSHTASRARHEHESDDNNEKPKTSPTVRHSPRPTSTAHSSGE